MAAAAGPANQLFADLPGGSKMPMTGLGMCCRVTAYHDESVRRSVLWYLLQGGRHIDTAALYLNHQAIGLGIKDAIARGIPRSEMFVTTKIWTTHYNYSLATEWVTDMLRELDLEYVDLVLMHAPRRNMGIYPGFVPKWHKLWPEWSAERKGLVWYGGLAALWPNYEDEDFKSLGCATAKECRQQTWKALSEARDKGLIKEAGVSNFKIKHLKELAGLGLAPIAVHQLPYHPWIPKWLQEIVEYCKEQSIAVTGYTSLGGVMGTGKSLSTETLKELSAKHKRSPAQVLQRWSLQKKVMVIPGSGNPAHMKENLEVLDFELTGEEMAQIDALNADQLLYVPDFLNE
eukprot:GHVU01120924.1.p1 GENE.GHVU01120924.1~~GHVU01120924.1.p1  ORF type:complete len:385 (+),score=62.42 GHVU01120924.1:122-1156(+)